MTDLNTPIKNLPRIGEKYAKALKKLDILTVRDLLFHFPFRYDDYSQKFSIKDIPLEQDITIEGKVTDIKTTRTWKRKIFLTEAIITDDSGSIKVIWFNQPYISDTLKIGKSVRISGKATTDKNKLFFSNPAYELASRVPTNTGRLVPVYPETGGVTSRWLRWQIQMLLKLNLKLTDSLPSDLLEKLNLPLLEKAVQQIHFPNDLDRAVISQKRFAFEEMFLIQLKTLQVKSSWKKEKAVDIEFDEELVKNFIDSLPFKLTNAQKKSSFQISKDLGENRPMNRLLNGDVGSGKTIVAAMASLQTMEAGYQVVIMAPTEVLARQHFENLSKLFAGYNFNVALLTNSYKILASDNTTRPNLLKKIQSGEINLVIGTHALIQKDVRFKNLALIVVDEQHRFGVAQRAYLQQEISTINDGIKDKVPHFLTMTATPIPRTLALAFFGNLDISILDEMPAKRKKIITEIVNSKKRGLTYEFIRKEIKNGRQIFVILPLVEESKVLTEIKAATEEHKRLSEKIFSDLRLGLLHGRLKSGEKENVMKDFKDKKIDILVSTAVVEVGIDIPNATVMLIEDADRFGLSQLHQFRGRVGRAEHQSYCFLFTSSDSSKTKARLKALVESENGFKIAEKDLELRGPGEFFGTRQSGIPDIAMENITNVKLIQVAREEAQNIIKSDPELKKHPQLAEALQKFSQKIHLE
ncbi:ATP-dependent DNA helicase RecG [bacterium BMS3Abin15]|nr:ATP-dependent DNA helicase RecG [bacterium BMS3Abin15]